MPQNVVIAGASGFLGRHLTDELVGRGHSVVALVRRPSSSPDESSWDPYAGVYEHPAYGDVKVVLENGALVMTRGEIVSDLAHWHYDTFQATNRGALRNKSLVTFQLGAKGLPAELVMGDLGVFSARAQSSDRH